MVWVVCACGDARVYAREHSGNSGLVARIYAGQQLEQPIFLLRSQQSKCMRIKHILCDAY